jgi:hypothetical protein
MIDMRDDGDVAQVHRNCSVASVARIAQRPPDAFIQG